MIKLVPSQPKWLASLIILIVANLFIGGCMPANQPPVIFSLTASEGQFNPSGSCQVKCVVSDPDGDELRYIWSASGGNISGEGPVATWVAPNAYRTYTVTVFVTDGKGGQAIKTIDIVVTCCL